MPPTLLSIPKCMTRFPRSGGMRRLARRGVLWALPLLASACALNGGLFGTVGPEHQPALSAPPAWYAPSVPHAARMAELRDWWSSFGDPQLPWLIEDAQKASPTLAQALARIESARAQVVAAGAASLPHVEAIAGASRSALWFGGPTVQRNLAQVGLQSAWEIDLFGGAARRREAAVAQWQSGQAGWHEARVALAAEVAGLYLGFRECRRQQAFGRQDLQIRREVYALQERAVRAGLDAASSLSPRRAALAEAQSALAQRTAACEAQFKALVALGTVGEPALRARLEPAGASPADVPGAPGFALAALPAEVLRQRPDIAAAERELAAASAAIGVQEAQLYPSLSLFGNILPSRSVLDGSPAQSLRTWTFGPSLNLPLFDAGSRQANLEAARSAYLAAQAGHQARVRLAVREIEEALVRLEAAGERLAQSAEILKAQTEIVAATERRVRAGLSARTELLEVQRAELAAQGLLVAARFEQSSAWVQLYRAAGGGWDGRLAPSASPETPRS